nr:hypothetical protein [Dechloromonas sp.]
MEYLENLVAKINHRDQWPDFDRPYFLDELNGIADDAYELNTVHGYLAGLLIYHQLTEEMLRLLLQYSEFYVQLSLAPVEIHFPIPDKAMFGRLLDAAKSSMDFENKADLLFLAQKINTGRIELVHGLTKQEDSSAINSKAQNVKLLFDEFYTKFIKAQDWFLLCFKDFRKNVEWEELLVDQ